MSGTGAWSAAPRLQGKHVLLEPLQTAHAQALREAVTDGELWNLWYTSVPRPEAVDAYVDEALAMQSAGKALAFAVRDVHGVVVGTTRYYDLDAATPRLQIGYTWYARNAQRTGLNTEAKQLLLAHAFETLGCIAVGFQTSWFNHASRAAIARLGAKQDGVIRNHLRHSDGSIRDTVTFSIIDSEWPAVKRHLQARLEEYAHG
ncbi:GNAT family N-acetyltransferase [Montanilutibacter psychrotolerans]|uniref:N-acetyltransferase n=1 Tax=Montanilutibacter psychrotolerans TaxID=1327343 RepID=A0A3M8T0E1_9GAMM|nr:GNAT family protein [Lysobacter psychrotolerans]RNF86425.1 N-acetyltransferase [Lysobacter psychrotolerans]